MIAAGEEEGIIEKGDRELIQSVVAFGDTTVREVMTPRPDIVAVDSDATLDELKRLLPGRSTPTRSLLGAPSGM